MKILRISRKTTGHYGVWAFVFFVAVVMFAWQIIDTARALQLEVRISGEPIKWWTYPLDFAIPVIFALSSFYAALRMTRAWWRRYCRMWNPEGLCRRCGYDLRATPDRCPECGKRTWGSRQKSQVA